MEFEGWKRLEGSYFGKADLDFEQIRPHNPDAPYELVETSYYGFHIPQAGLNCEIYHWAHPVFGTTSGGIWIYGKGRIGHMIESEFFDYRNFMPLPADITDCTYEDGIKVKVAKPMEEVDISYKDTLTDTSLRLNLKAVMPPAFRPAGGHMTQAMKTTGALILHGKEIQIDGYFTRDRSWGDPRSEKRKNIPPFGWYVVVFNDNLAFHFSVFESPDENALLSKNYPALADGKNFIWGYIWKDGKLIGVKSCKNIVKRAADGVTPLSTALEAIDENGERYALDVVIQGVCPLNAWTSLYAYFCSALYTYNGLTAWGEYQEGMGPQCYNQSLRTQS